MVLNTSELFPDPDTPVNTVSRRFGISMLTSLRLFSRAPSTRIRSWLSAMCGSVIGSPCGRALLPEFSWEEGGGSGLVLDEAEDVAVGVGEGGDEATAAVLARGVLHGGAGGGHLGELRLDVGDVPVRHRR